MNLPTFTAAKLNDFTVVGSYKHANEVATNTQDCITSTTTTAINMPKINTEDQLGFTTASKLPEFGTKF